MGRSGGPPTGEYITNGRGPVREQSYYDHETKKALLKQNWAWACMRSDIWAQFQLLFGFAEVGGSDFFYSMGADRETANGLAEGYVQGATLIMTEGVLGGGFQAPSVMGRGASTAGMGEYTTIYRAVSQAEVDDIANFGFRMNSGGYETGKLFAPTFEEAAQFGKYNFGFDGIPNTIMRARVPNNVLNNATKFGADGMNAISIPADQLHLLYGEPINFSPWLK